MIMKNESALSAVKQSTRANPNLLLIDEINVLLSDKYYGGMYIPSVYLKDHSIKALLDSIWQSKTVISLNKVKALPAYTTCDTKYSNWIFFFDEAIKDMLTALQSYQSSTYIVQKDRIVYVEGESLVDNMNSLEENVGILIDCGTFLYAEMPHDFAYIGDVTGTLKTLANVEKQIVEKVYGINKATIMPSVFGSCNRNYNPENDVRVVDENEYFMYILGEINPIHLSSIKSDVQIITEKVSAKERELCMKHAATIGKITLITRIFSRGTDFICRNQNLLANGGIHVVQMFSFSEELSEEYQIMGRGARQGDQGSYRMILLDNDLEWILGSLWETEIPKIMDNLLYKTLNGARTKLDESKCSAKELDIAQCRTEHKASKEFLNALTSENIEQVKLFLKKRNEGINSITASSRTVLLMDATDSMSNLLSATKETVCTVFERASTILTEKGLPNDAFQMQFAVYRNYNCKENEILQVSPWTIKCSSLREIMNSIRSCGGWRCEAIEIGLSHAVQESEIPESISQVILIGDAPANTQADVSSKRAHFGEPYRQNTRFSTPTYYATELQKLKNKKFPSMHFTSLQQQQKISKNLRVRHLAVAKN
ncbi:unnamed protein product [Rotaria sp. Silwood2]|nr:unnamed protein product [Rotaria sp. Silwood2]CAF3958106.1 unnamed protein product [Rotaria sp. Silwood2]